MQRIYLVLILLFPVCGWSQSGWQLHLQQAVDAVALDVTETADHSLFACGVEVDSNTFARYPAVWKLSAAGDLMQHATFPNLPQHTFHSIFSLNDTLVLAGTAIRQANHELILYRLTESLDLIDTMIVGASVYDHVLVRARMAVGDDILLVGHATHADSLWSDLFVCRTGFGASRGGVSYFPHPGIQYGYDIALTPDSNYLVAAMNYPDEDPSFETTVVTFDSDMNYVSYVELDQQMDSLVPDFGVFPSLISLLPLSESTYLVGGEIW